MVSCYTRFQQRRGPTAHQGPRQAGPHFRTAAARRSVHMETGPLGTSNRVTALEQRTDGCGGSQNLMEKIGGGRELWRVLKSAGCLATRPGRKAPEGARRSHGGSGGTAQRPGGLGRAIGGRLGHAAEGGRGRAADQNGGPQPNALEENGGGRSRKGHRRHGGLPKIAKQCRPMAMLR